MTLLRALPDADAAPVDTGAGTPPAQPAPTQPAPTQPAPGGVKVVDSDTWAIWGDLL